MSGRLVRLAVIGTAAGAFSGLFGVGGGTIIVPLLILWFGFGEREATGTSLAAIALIAVLGAALHGFGYANVHPEDGLLVGIPAIAGVVAGTALQQRVPERTVAICFAVLLVASAALLIF
ncbi:MAG: sulfite exporter TauE/SafE family protein [Thermoleophilaceae bacterium]|nr:sulfite exporter TauE/SafE family protein [Thermoleophilaceae bacterium]